MARSIVGILLCVCILFGAEVLEISAEKIYTNQLKGETKISGNVEIVKQQDRLKADEVVIKTDKQRKPLKYTANGNVKFQVMLQGGRLMQGHAKKVIYDAIKDEYLLMGKAYVQEEGKPNAIKGNEIMLNKAVGSASVVGTKKKPAKITFSLEDKDG